MSVIIEERGRGKFRPASNYNVSEVKEVLNTKIEEERQAFEDCNVKIEFHKLSYDPNKWNLLSLFSGCGGLDLGFELAGLKAIKGGNVMEDAFADKKVFDDNINNNVFNTIYVNDIFDEARETYAQNAGKYIYMDKSDIRKIKEFPQADIVLGGFPCPGFSEAGPRLVDDKRNFLYLHFIRCLMQSKPKIFVAENVKGMMTLGKGEVFKQIVQDFTAAGYTIYHKLLNSAEYGVPQIRERVILVGIRNDIDFKYSYPEATHGYGIEGLKEVVTLKDAIGDLEEDPGEYFTGSYSTIFMSRNRKKLWSQPSFTIQASGRQAPIHPAGAPMVNVGKDKFIFSDGEENNRRLSVKEIARIQTFPDWYEFSRGTSNRNDNAKLDLVYKQIGNAVPVRLALAVAEPIAEFAKTDLEKKKEETEYVAIQNINELKQMMA
ncbi:MAG: DNA cytosine methyltransferase [Lachnospiraceae bacterium]|nr:DNA cytosine methyltransferase [Lachnospiraceae bacterium]